MSEASRNLFDLDIATIFRRHPAPWSLRLAVAGVTDACILDADRVAVAVGEQWINAALWCFYEEWAKDGGKLN